MKFQKEQLLEAALALNGEDKKYQITVEDDKIITRVKWMDATFFSPASVTDEVKEFEYTVKVNDDGTYTELDRSVATVTSANRGGLNFNKQIFIGKQMTYSKTIGIGKNHQDDSTGVVEVTFYSEEYKQPVRDLLKSFGVKKKMGLLGKIFIGAGILVLVAVIAVCVLLTQMNNKEVISVSDFEEAARASGYQVGVDEFLENTYDYLQYVRIAVDDEDDYQIDYYVLLNDEYAKEIYESNRISFLEMEEQEKIIISGSADSSKYEKYTSTTNSAYRYLARIDNTVLYVDVDKEHKEEVEDFIKKINY